MVVLHYIPSIDVSSGGVGSYIQLLAKPLGRLVELHIATHQGERPLTIENATIHYIGASMFGGMRREWSHLLDELHPDVVHANSCWLPMSALAQKVAQQKGYKVVLTPHGMLEPWIIRRNFWTRKLPAMLLFQKSAVHKADVLHATAEKEKQDLLHLGWNNRVAVVPNGVEVEHIMMKSSWERRNRILFLSRIHIQKGIDFLVKAASRLKNELRGFEIIVAGEGEATYLSALEQKVQQLGVSDMIRFVGGVYGERKWQLFREVDLLVLPSFTECFGIVVAEALASGTPVITTTGTPWEELKTHHCGWQIEVGTAPLVTALRSFLDCSVAELEEMGRNGRQLITTRYSASIIAEQMVEMYRNLVGNG